MTGTWAAIVVSALPASARDARPAAMAPRRSEGNASARSGSSTPKAMATGGCPGAPRPSSMMPTEKAASRPARSGRPGGTAPRLRKSAGVSTKERWTARRAEKSIPGSPGAQPAPTCRTPARPRRPTPSAAPNAAPRSARQARSRQRCKKQHRHQGAGAPPVSEAQPRTGEKCEKRAHPSVLIRR